MDTGDTEVLRGIEHLVKTSVAKSELSEKAHLTEGNGGRCSLNEHLVEIGSSVMDIIGLLIFGIV